MSGSTGPGPAVLDWPAWRTVNITPAERAGRITIGVAAIIAGIVLLVGTGSAPAIVLEALMVVAGLDLAVTGAIVPLPLYAKLGYLPKSLRRDLFGALAPRVAIDLLAGRPVWQSIIVDAHHLPRTWADRSRAGAARVRRLARMAPAAPAYRRPGADPVRGGIGVTS